MAERPSTTRPGVVQKIIPSPIPGQPEKALIISIANFALRTR